MSPSPTLLLRLPESESPLFRPQHTLPLFYPSFCLSLWASLAASANHCFCLFCLDVCLCPLFLRRSSSVLCALLCPSSSGRLGFLAGFSLFHLFILCISSLHILPFFPLRRPEAIWDGEWGDSVMGWTMLSETGLWTRLGLCWDWEYVWNH